MIFVRSLLILLIALPASALEVRVEPVGFSPDETSVLTRLILQRPEIAGAFQGIRFRVLDSAYDSAPPRGLPGYRLAIYDYTHERMVEVSGDLEGRDPPRFTDTDPRQPPSPEEFEEAVKLVLGVPELADAFARGLWRAYPSMPMLIDTGHPSRVIAVGLMPQPGARGQAFRHEIVGVDLSGQRVIRYPERAPPTALATDRACAPPNAFQGVTGRGTPGSAIVTVLDGATEIWKMQLIRPSASSGGYGSGIELRNVKFRGHLLLKQAHTPILNVLYDGNVCGPYRDWQYEENAFNATGTLLAPGILKTSEPPSTIATSLSDRGNFRGVAVSSEGELTRLVSEVSAGWYRYTIDWRFHQDGTIEPRWTFSAIQDSCTCYSHRHHAYWRFDFDMDGESSNRIQVLGSSGWSPLERETRQYRGPEARAWRVSNPRTGLAYEIDPGENDGTAQGDRFGKGDFWALVSRPGQIDDTAVRRDASAWLDAFVDGESLSDADSVLWYGAHFYHVSDDDHAHNHTVGPVLRPLNWPAR